MVTPVRQLSRFPYRDFMRISENTGILLYPPFSGDYYKGVWLAQQLGEPYSYPTSESIYGIINREDMKSFRPEGTRTLILIPNGRGELTPRASIPNGKPLTGYKVPMVSEDFTVIWNEQKDELDHLEINPSTLRCYPQLLDAFNLATSESGLYTIEWDKGLPVVFSNVQNEEEDVKSDKLKVGIDSEYEHGYGERPIIFRRGIRNRIFYDKNYTATFHPPMQPFSNPDVSYRLIIKVGDELFKGDVTLPIETYQQVLQKAVEISKFCCRRSWQGTEIINILSQS